MGIDRWIKRLLPRDDNFLGLFEQDVENLGKACTALRQLLDARGDADRARLVKEIKDIEHRGDEITHEIFSKLTLTFITPFDREDIGRLASSLDDILDLLDQAAMSIQLYDITAFGDAVVDLADIIEKSVAELRKAIPLLHDLRNGDKIREACVRVNAFENQADTVFHRALGHLFKQEKDPISIIKTKELLSVLESATDSCEDAADLLENVLLKHA